jgi:MFS family permease
MTHIPYALGLRVNHRAFVEQLIQVFFVGLTIGLQRTVIPALAESEFGVAQGSATALMAFVVSFGVVKGAMNFVSGRLSERVGRRPVLIWGWLVALPIPFMILLAPSWGWIVAANVLLGVNQGFAWSMTVTAKMDIVTARERGLATGFNEFAGYSGVALAGLATGYLASTYSPRMTLFVFGLTVIALALLAARLAFTETLPFARAEAARLKDVPAPEGTYVIGPDTPTTRQIFALVTWRNRSFMALSQAGSVEKFVDALMWALVPAFLAAKSASLIQIGWITGLYGLTWGVSQLWTAIRPYRPQDSHRDGLLPLRGGRDRISLRPDRILLGRNSCPDRDRHGAPLPDADRRHGRPRPPRMAGLGARGLSFLARSRLRHRRARHRSHCRCDRHARSRLLVHRRRDGGVRSVGLVGIEGNPSA